MIPTCVLKMHGVSYIEHVNMGWMLYPDEPCLVLQRRSHTKAWDKVLMAVHVGSTNFAGFNNFSCWQTGILQKAFKIIMRGKGKLFSSTSNLKEQKIPFLTKKCLTDVSP